MSKTEADVVQMGGLGAEMFQDCSPVQQRWLSAYCLSGDAEQASEQAGVKHLEAMTWIRDDSDFLEAMNQARMVVGYMLEATALAKAKTEEGSDRLIIELLRAMMPERYDKDAKGINGDDEYEGGFGGGIIVVPEDSQADAV